MVNKVRKYYNTKKATAKQQGIAFELELRDVYWLLYMAGITVEQIGKGREDYQLSRFNDSGPYAIGNCRFITMLENQRERDYSFPKHRPTLTEEHKRRISESQKKCIL